ncbi:MAG: hypothetical protein LQ343_003546 [Gyalolechia ehrenbergii]|nr:MAG: hypothetical protein LQ343_003546 [Gyalolechia ehrenbergii]
MSTMTTTSHPPSPNFSIRTTQNTAPVLSFNCLYTHDLRRKAKRWQDGILRFHTFNKRVMVYDVPRNFIGDTHWREPQEIQDGDELELEKGVLIQVGEENGRTETDLSELLEKNKAKPVPAGDQRDLRDAGKNQAAKRRQVLETPDRVVRRPSASSFAQLRPKSLNALLGRSSGIIGRAAVPKKSPAELRREKENHHSGKERSPKRRRIQYPENTSPSVSSAGIRRTELDSPPAERAKSVAVSTEVAKPTTHHVSRISEERRLGGDANLEPLKNPAVVSPNVRRSNQSKGDQGKRDLRPDDHREPDTLPAVQVSPRRKGQEAGKSRRREPEAALHQRKGPSKPNAKNKAAPKEIPGAPAQPVEDLLEKQILKDMSLADEPRREHLLRIASKKPRKKLMYRDLLPQKAPPDQDIRPPNAHLLARLHEPPNTRPANTLDDFHDAQRNRLQNRLNRRTRSAEIPTEQTHVHQDANLEDHPAPPNKASDNPNLHSMTSESLFLTTPSPIETGVKSAPSRPDEPNIPNIPPTDSIPSSTQAARALTKLDALLLQHPFEPQPQQRQQPKPETIKAALPPHRPSRPFQRSISDLTTSAASKPPPTNQLAKRATTGLRETLSSNNPAPVPAPIRLPSLQRSNSSVSYEQAADPWSREAWDLFGFEGGDKRVGTGNGVKGDEDGRKEGAWEDGLVESQGWV